MAHPTHTHEEEMQRQVQEANLTEAHGHPVEPEIEAEVPTVEEPPQHVQDTMPIEGECVLHPPPGDELVQRGRIQG